MRNDAIVAPTEADDADERRLYGRPQHEEGSEEDEDGNAVEETTYGDPQHEPSVEPASDFELARATVPVRDPCGFDRREPLARPPPSGVLLGVTDV
jgi:hypothetical protein